MVTKRLTLSEAQALFTASKSRQAFAMLFGRAPQNEAELAKFNDMLEQQRKNLERLPAELEKTKALVERDQRAEASRLAKLIAGHANSRRR